MMMQLEKLIGNLFIGNCGAKLESFYTPMEKFQKEKEEIIQKAKLNKELTETQYHKQKNFIKKLEDMTLKLSKEIDSNRQKYNLFKDLQNMVILYDFKFKVIETNPSFINEFKKLDENKENPNENKILKHIENIPKENITYATIDLKNEKINYEKEFEIKIDDIKYKVNTSPILDNSNQIFNFFVRIFTRI